MVFLRAFKVIAEGACERPCDVLKFVFTQPHQGRKEPGSAAGGSTQRHVSGPVPNLVLIFRIPDGQIRSWKCFGLL